MLRDVVQPVDFGAGQLMSAFKNSASTMRLRYLELQVQCQMKSLERPSMERRYESAFWSAGPDASWQEGFHWHFICCPANILHRYFLQLPKVGNSLVNNFSIPVFRTTITKYGSAEISETPVQTGNATTARLSSCHYPPPISTLQRLMLTL